MFNRRVFGGKKEITDLTYRGRNGTAANGNYTYTNAPIGTASSTRYVIAVVAAYAGSGSAQINVTFGGSAAEGYARSAASRSPLAIAWKKVTTGTSIDVRAITTGDSFASTHIGVFTCEVAGNGLEVVESSWKLNPSDPQTLTDIEVVSGGLLLAATVVNLLQRSVVTSWNGVDSLTEHYDALYGDSNGRRASAHSTLTTEDATTGDVTFNWSSAPTASDFVNCGIASLQAY